MIYFLVFAVETLLFLELLKRVKLVGATHMILIYIIISQFVFVNASFLDYYEDASGMSSYLYNTTQGIILYFGIYVVVYCSSLGLRIQNNKNIQKEILIFISKSKSLQKYLFFGISFLMAVDVMAMDWSYLWFNTTYIYINSPQVLVYLNPLTQTIHAAANFIFIIAVMAFFVNLFQSDWKWAAIWFAPAFWAFWFSLASSSRIIAVLLFSGLVIAYITLNKMKIFACSVLLILSIIGMSAALSGRGGGEFGLSSAFDILYGAFSHNFNISTLLVNFCQGIFVTNDSLLLKPYFTDRYVLGSFSPFPAFIDGFDQIRASDEVRLQRYVPMSAIAEVIHFGPLYVVLFFAFFVICLRQCVNISKQNGLTYAIFTPIIFWIFVSANAYPARNVLRQIFIAIIIMACISGWRKYKMMRGRGIVRHTRRGPLA
jgi:hypothetical protein